ncbi:MAG: polyprenyl synthetase family protein [Candidatus Saccharimonadaceae bacterium]
MNYKNLAVAAINEELNKFDLLYSSMKSENPRLQKMIEHMYKADGKKIRPTLLLLTAKALGEVNEKTYHAAVTIELLHTATLIHDDVVDDANMRRGQPSLNSLFDNKKTVLCGDFFLSSALTQSVLTGDLEIVSIIANLGKKLAEGELQQLFIADEIIIDEEEYFNVIRKKTASLLSACMKIGALTVNAPRNVVNQFSQLGELIGMSVQLRDDIFDYFDDNIGKPTGNDIREGKITLPLLFALKNSEIMDNEKALAIIQNKDFTDSNIVYLIDFAKNNGGIEYTYSVLQETTDKAKQIVNDMNFETEGLKSSFMSVIQYLKERKY